VISHQHKFIFIHVYKVAGTSMRQVLRPYVSGLTPTERLVNRLARKLGGRNLFQPYEQPLDAHATASEYKAHLGALAYEEYFTFSFVRNPFDWLVSLYEYVRQAPHDPYHALILEMSFAQFITWRCGEALKRQCDFVREDGKIIVDFIGRFENLNVDVATAFSRAGVRGEIKHLNSSRRRPYPEYYDTTTRRQVVSAYAEDFDLFEYSREV
jgi:hypothetical protein